MKSTNENSVLNRVVPIVLPRLLPTLALAVAACQSGPSETLKQDTDSVGVSCASIRDLATGPRTLVLNGAKRTYHVRVPKNLESATPMPVLFGFHGTGGSSAWFVDDKMYELESVVGEQALLVYPDALPGSDGVAQWKTEVDYAFFDEILAQLEGCFDPARVFVTGHSSGGSIAHSLGCARGDVIRAIAPVAGVLSAEDCVGEVAVLQMHGVADTRVPVSNGLPARDYWATRNGCDLQSAIAKPPAQCEAYANCDSGFEVQWCPFIQQLADGETGHEWPKQGGEIIWRFFSSLPIRSPGEASPDRSELPPPEGSARARFRLRYPDNLMGIPKQAAASLYAANTRQPLRGAPLHLIELDFPIGTYSAGAETAYAIDVNLAGVEPGPYTLAINVYVEGGSYPIPQPGRDYVALAPIVIEKGVRELVFDDPLVLELLEPPPM